MSRTGLGQLFLELHQARASGRFVPVEYLDEYWSLVAFSDGYFAARDHEPDESWERFKAWLSTEGIVEGSEGWRLAIPRLAEKRRLPPATLLFELLERFEAQRSDLKTS